MGIEAGEGIKECGKLEKGEVCYGELKELGLPYEKPKRKIKVKLANGEIVDGEPV